MTAALASAFADIFGASAFAAVAALKAGKAIEEALRGDGDAEPPRQRVIAAVEYIPPPRRK